MDRLFPCAYKSIFGIDCPACGFQRAFLELANGNILESFRLYPPLIPSLILIAMFIVHLCSKRMVSRRLLYIAAITDLVLVLLSYGLKMFHIFPLE